MFEEISLGSIITTARRRMGWTQQEVADKFDTPVSRVTVNRWEKDEQRPSDFNIKQLISILGLNEKEADALNRASAQPTLRRRILPLRNELFTGREGQLEQLSQLLKENSSVALCGLPGIGKTQLALEYAHRSFPDVYRAVFWVDATDREMLQASYDKIARKLELPEQHEHDQERRIEAVKDWLEDHTNWLLIMDNADDLSLARSFFPSAHDGHILLTTRTQIVGNIAKKFEIEKMKPKEGQLFLLRRSKILEVEDTLDDIAADTCEDALEMVELLGGHPLALDQAGAYIEGGVSFTDYIDLYHEQRRCLLEDRGPLDGDHPESVVVSFELCHEKAREQHPLATDILCFCAFLHPDAIPDELFKHDDRFKLDKLAFKKGKEALLRYSLMKHNAHEKTLSMHRLVQTLLIDDMPPDLQKQWGERVVRALNAAFPYVDLKDCARCRRLLPHVLACVRLMEDEDWLTPIVGVTDLFQKAATYLHSEGYYSPAEIFLTLALIAMYEQHLGVDNPDIATALDNLAILYQEQGKHKQAEPLLLDALAIRVRCLGPEDPDTARSLYLLTRLMQDQGKHVEAEALYQRALMHALLSN